MSLERMMERAVTVVHATIERSESGEVTLSYGAGTEVLCTVGSAESRAGTEEHARATRTVLVCYFPPSADIRTSPPDRVTVDGGDYELTAVEKVERAGKLRALKARMEKVG